jgi:peroxiredoxin
MPSAVPDRFRRHALARLAGGAAAALLAACESADAPRRPWTGAKFPAFELPSPDGRLHASGDYAGQPLLINFWATWCPPCRGEMADLEALQRRLAPAGLRLLAISVDEDVNLVREYLRREGLTFTVLLDAGQRWAGAALGVPGFPTTYLVGRDGVIRDALVGPRAWVESPMLETVAARLELG